MEQGLEGEHDWLFDLMADYLGSAEFNDAVADFVDEHCELFKNEEENKLIHTDIHNEFKEHVEMLITSKLAEFSVPATTLVEACSVGRQTRGLNMEVFNRLVALDDFLHFKKMMVKRNAELELEALREIQRHLEHSGGDGQTTREAAEADIKNSILQLDIMHRQEEIEQMALDQAIALSLSLSHEHTAQASPALAVCTSEEQVASSADAPTFPNRRHQNDNDNDAATPQPKHPTARRLQPLPPLADRKQRAQQTCSELVDGFDPGQLYAAQVRVAERMLSQQRKALANDRETAQQLIDATAGGGSLAAAVAAAKDEDLEARARHLRAVRDQLRAKKKTQEPQGKSQPVVEQAVGGDAPEQHIKSADAEPLDASELRRQAVGMALARRLKYELLDAQHERLRDLQEGHMRLLDKQMQLLAVLREQSKRKEQELAQAVRRCQAQLGSGITHSRQLPREGDELDLK